MAKNTVTMTFKIQEDGSLKAIGQQAEKTSKNLDKTGKSAHSTDRQLKGAAQASSNTTKNFSKMSQGIQGTLVPAYATLAATLFAVSALFRGLEQAFNWKAQTEGLAFFARETGIAMEGLVAQMREATGGVLEFKEAAQAAQIGTAAGLSPSDLKQLAEGAKLASAALGRDLTDSFNRLIRGVTKAEPELLDELGIVLRLDVATRRYAAAHGLVASKLTLSQRRAAVNNEVMMQLNDNFGEFGEKADDLVNPFTRLQTAFSDIIRNLSGGVLEPLVAVADFLSDNAEAATLLFAGFAAGILRSAFPALKTLGTSLTEFGINAKKNATTAKKSFTDAATNFKTNSRKMILSDKVKSKSFQKILKKMGIQEKFNNMERVADQKRSLKMMLNNEKSKTAKVAALSKSELAQLRMVYAAMVTSHAQAMNRIAAATGVAGAAITTGITLPAFLAQGALAGIGRAITAMAPALTALGTLFTAVFGIASFVFIGKFIYDMITTSKKQRDETRKAGKEWQAIKKTLEEIMDIQQDGFIEGQKTSIKYQRQFNKELVKQYNLMQSLMSRKELSKMLEDGKDPSAWFVQNILGLAQVDKAGVKSQIEEIVKSYKPSKMFRPTKPDGSYFTDDDMRASAVKEVMKHISNKDADSLLKTLQRMMPSLLENSVALFGFADGLGKIKQDAGNAGEGITNFTNALKNYEEVSDRMFEKYKVSDQDQMMLALNSLLTGNTEAQAGTPYLEVAGTKLEKQLGLKSDPLPEDQGGGFKRHYDEATFARQAELAKMLLTINKKSQETLKARVNYFKRIEAIAKRMNDSHSKQEALQAKITYHEEQKASLTLDIMTNTMILQGVAEGNQQMAKEELETQMHKLETINFQTDALKEQQNQMHQLRKGMIEGMDSSGQKAIGDLIMGKERSGKDAILGTLQGTLQAGAGVLSEQLMAPITGSVKKLFGIKSPEDRQKQIMEDHITGMEAAMKAHVEGLGGNWEGGGVGDKAVSGIKDLLTGEKGFMEMFKGLFSGGDWFSSIFSLFGFGAKGGMVRKYNAGTGPAGAKYVPGTGNRDTVPAMLTPGEIVIPKGKRVGGNYNTTVNVNMEGGGDVTTDDQMGEAFGQAIQVAVTEEISKQQLPGGLLSPFGGA